MVIDFKIAGKFFILVGVVAIIAILIGSLFNIITVSTSNKLVLLLIATILSLVYLLLKFKSNK